MGADVPGLLPPRPEPGRVAVVTDSTACLPRPVIDKLGIGCVSCQVVLGNRSYDELTEATGSQVAEALRERVRVSTSRPPPEALLGAYRAAADGGASAVASIHLSAEVSGTYEAAELAAKEAPLSVQVVNSRSIGMGLGFAVVSATEAALTGASLPAVAAAAERRARAASAYFYVDTLEHLRRGGRIGSAAALLGSVLSVKPLLHVVDGRVVPLEKVRTSGRAVARLEEIVAARAAASGGPVDLAVHYLVDRERAEWLAQRLRERIRDVRQLYVTEIGAVVGAHVGPGMLGVVVAPVVA